MSDLVIKSPSGKYHIGLDFDFELRFGPFAFIADYIGFDMDININPVLDNCIWSESEKYLAIIEYSASKKISLFIVDIVGKQVIKVCENNGLIKMISISDRGALNYTVKRNDKYDDCYFSV